MSAVFSGYEKGHARDNKQGLNPITAGQRTMSGWDDHLSGQTFGLPVIFTEHVNKWPEKKKHFHTITFQEDKYLFSLYVFTVRRDKWPSLASENSRLSSLFVVREVSPSGKERKETVVFSGLVELRILGPVNTIVACESIRFFRLKFLVSGTRRVKLKTWAENTRCSRRLTRLAIVPNLFWALLKY